MTITSDAELCLHLWSLMHHVALKYRDVPHDYLRSACPTAIQIAGFTLVFVLMAGVERKHPACRECRDKKLRCVPAQEGSEGPCSR
jgi:hypothetical protein